MGLSVWQLAIVAVLILILFGRGRISEMMGDFGKGVSSFKKGLNDGPDAEERTSETAQIKGPDASTSNDAAKDSQSSDKSGG